MGVVRLSVCPCVTLSFCTLNSRTPGPIRFMFRYVVGHKYLRCLGYVSNRYRSVIDFYRSIIGNLKEGGASMHCSRHNSRTPGPIRFLFGYVMGHKHLHCSPASKMRFPQNSRLNFSLCSFAPLSNCCSEALALNEEVADLEIFTIWGF